MPALPLAGGNKMEATAVLSVERATANQRKPLRPYLVSLALSLASATVIMAAWMNVTHFDHLVVVVAALPVAAVLYLFSMRVLRSAPRN